MTSFVLISVACFLECLHMDCAVLWYGLICIVLHGMLYIYWHAPTSSKTGVLAPRSSAGGVSSVDPLFTSHKLPAHDLQHRIVLAPLTRSR